MPALIISGAAMVSSISDLTKSAEVIPSSLSASSPLPAPSTVKSNESISLADWSAVAPDSIPSNLFFKVLVKTLESTAALTNDLISAAV